MWKCADPELEQQIHCFPYGECSDVPWLQQVEQKAVRWQRNLGLVTSMHLTLSPLHFSRVQSSTLAAVRWPMASEN